MFLLLTRYHYWSDNIMDIYLFKGLCSQYTLVPAILVIIFGVVPICLPRNAKHTAAMPSRNVETNLMFKARQFFRASGSCGQCIVRLSNCFLVI